ncbi:GyrI-like domain-containing protein [Paenibacillus sp. MMS18-CY102]|uniref:GyrI-like domain-containing protein n=1 Tax=Paenibacillus sp. MMS18-CY102 TaxID=2682849 RepID=UPI003FA6E1BB
MAEGECIQFLHIGPYSTEPASLEKMYAFMHQHGLAQNGRHHLIYLSDPRKAAPDKRKTILRLPVKGK